jgi:hypothetical protein
MYYSSIMSELFSLMPDNLALKLNPQFCQMKQPWGALRGNSRGDRGWGAASRTQLPLNSLPISRLLNCSKTVDLTNLKWQR